MNPLSSAWVRADAMWTVGVEVVGTRVMVVGGDVVVLVVHRDHCPGTDTTDTTADHC